MKLNVKLFFAVCTAFLVSCLSPYEGEIGLPGTGVLEETSDLFNPPTGEGMEGVIRFYTNEPKYRTSSGYTLWAHKPDTANAESEVSVEVQKTLGSDTAGYGLVLYSKRRMILGVERQVFLTMMINNKGQYAVGKVIEAAYNPVVPWTTSGRLHNGRGIKNRLKVVHNSQEPNKYELYFNDGYAGYFVDGEEPYCNGRGQSGYVVVISPTDLNNGGAVEVLFEE